jgi:hypothetical protein
MTIAKSRRQDIAILAALAALVTAVAACSSATTGPATELTNAARARLLGSWTFLRACGGIAGQCTPTSNEPTRYLFRTDDSVEAFRDGQRLFRERYDLVPGAADSTAGDTRPALLIGLGPTVDPRPLRVRFVGDSVLVLDEGCCDRFSFEYRRER